MSQSDLIIEGGITPGSPSRTDVRVDVQAGLQAVGSNQKGPSPPPTLYVGMWWLQDNVPSATVWTLWLRVTSTWGKVATVDSTTGVVSPVGVASGVPSGFMGPFAGSAAPAGWLLCDGSSLLRASYGDLFTAIGTTYGSADGTHFNLPDLRGRMTIGRDTMGGGTPPGRVTAAGGGVDGATLGAVGGAQSRTLDLTNVPSHAHAGGGVPSDSTGTGGTAPTVIRGSDIGGGDIPTSNTGSAGGTAGVAVPVKTLPPVIVFNYIIKT